MVRRWIGVAALVLALAVAAALGVGLTRWLGHRPPDQARLVRQAPVGVTAVWK